MVEGVLPAIWAQAGASAQARRGPRRSRRGRGGVAPSRPAAYWASERAGGRRPRGSVAVARSWTAGVDEGVPLVARLVHEGGAERGELADGPLGRDGRRRAVGQAEGEEELVVAANVGDETAEVRRSSVGEGSRVREDLDEALEAHPGLGGRRRRVGVDVVDVGVVVLGAVAAAAALGARASRRPLRRGSRRAIGDARTAFCAPRNRVLQAWAASSSPAARAAS